jgi:uncharacterized protein YjbI with pentapeptide repeats
MHTFPGELLDELVGKKQWIPVNFAALAISGENYGDRPHWTSIHDLLFYGGMDRLTRHRSSLFSNTLVLPGFDALKANSISDVQALDWVKQTINLRGRHLEGAILSGADLRKADLFGAKLQGAWLINANLSGALIAGAQLQGATLDYANLHGALLMGAHLQAASLDDAQLQAAALDGAQLQGASLKNAQLQGAALAATQLQGAFLEGARLEGSSLDNAHLQGANFEGAYLIGVEMRSANIWRANFEGAHFDKISESDLREDQMTNRDFLTLKDFTTQGVPQGDRLDFALKRIVSLDPGAPTPNGEDSNILRSASADQSSYETALAEQLKKLVCSGDVDAPYFVRGLIGAGMLGYPPRVKAAGAHAVSLIRTILDPDCPVFIELTNDDKALLKEIEMQQSAAAAAP